MDGLARLRPNLCLVYIEGDYRTWSQDRNNPPHFDQLTQSTKLYVDQYYVHDKYHIFYAPKTLIKWSD